jgi:hypothetical protein
MPRWLTVKELVAWLKLRRPTVRDPLKSGTFSPPPPIVEEQRAQRTYSPAQPSAPWTQDITARNAQIAKDYDDEMARRTALFEKGEYTPRFGKINRETGEFEHDIAYDVEFEMARANVTGLQPLQPELTPQEFKDARTVSGLTSEIQSIEASQRDKTVVMPTRPTRQEVLDATGGDEARAAMLQKRVDELFGEPADAEK